MKRFVRVVVYGVVAVAVLFAGAAIALHSVNADSYRPQVISLLSEKTGRVVKMNGPMTFSFGLGGLRVTVQNVSLANPAWATRPLMAAVGRLELGVGVLPLLAHRIEVKQLLIENADIMVETAPGGAHNWDFPALAAVPEKDFVPEPKPITAMPHGSLIIDGIRIINSQLAVRNVGGETLSYNVASLTLMRRSTGAELRLRGDINGAPIVMNVKTSLLDLLSHDAFTFDVDATYNALHVAVLGKADEVVGRAEISAYEVTAGKSKVTGDGFADWSGARTVMRGALKSDHLSPADFRQAVNGTEVVDAASVKAASAAGRERVFNDTPLPLTVLKLVDADMEVAVGEYPVGQGVLKNVVAKMKLADGVLVLSPVRAVVGGAPVEVMVKLNAAQTPARYAIGLSAEDVDLRDVQRLGGMSPYLSGKAGINVQLAGEGNSAHEIASSLGGVITVAAEKGQILTSAAAGISSSLASIFSTVSGDDALNCLAARFIVKNGVLYDNGILIDSAASTVAGGGTVNLGSETVKLVLRAKTKLVDIGSLVPVLQIGGTLANPTYSVDAPALVKSVTDVLSGDGSSGGAAVPAIQNAPNGQNACIYTLNHPKKTSSTAILPSDPVAKAGQKLQNLMKGLFGQ